MSRLNADTSPPAQLVLEILEILFVFAFQGLQTTSLGSWRDEEPVSFDSEMIRPKLRYIHGVKPVSQPIGCEVSAASTRRVSRRWGRATCIIPSSSLGAKDHSFNSCVLVVLVTPVSSTACTIQLNKPFGTSPALKDRHGARWRIDHSRNSQYAEIAKLPRTTIIKSRRTGQGTNALGIRQPCVGSVIGEVVMFGPL
jgi:hypothetical protein